jgi:hypothetical protein
MMQKTEKWFLWGVEVRKEEFEQTPESVEIEKQILLEKNAQRRMAFLKKVGIERFLVHVKPKIIDTLNVSTGGEYELLTINLQNFKGTFLKMKNPSTGFFHVEGVPDKISTCREALAWRKPKALQRIPVSKNGAPWRQQGDVCIWPAEAESVQEFPEELF